MLTVLAGLAALYVAVGGFLFVFQRSFLYVPDRGRPVAAVADVAGLREATLATSDGLRLLAWYLPPQDGAPLVVYFHGNGGSLADRIPRLRRFADAGYGVLMPEWRGYGGNPGAPSEAGFFADAAAAMAFVDALGIPPARRVLYGESIGTGVAVAVATRATVAALVLESPYTSIADIARRRFFLLPVDWLLHDRFDSLSRIGEIRAPLLILQGGRDVIVPPLLGQRLFAAANEPKTFWAAPDAGHNNLMEFGAFDAVTALIARTAQSPAVDVEKAHVRNDGYQE